jgi:hypothetical protein
MYHRRSIGQSVLVSSTHLGLTTRILFLSDSYGFVDVGRSLSLTKERVYRLQLLLVLASEVILGSESRGTRDHILLSQIRDSPKLKGQVPVCIFPRNRVTRLYPQALGSIFAASYDSHGYDGGIIIRLHAGSNLNSSVYSSCNRPSLYSHYTDHIENFHYCRDKYITQSPSNQSRRVFL